MKRKTRRGKINYFGSIEEDAVVLFLSSDDYHFRDEIYNKWLRMPLNKMADSIIRKYGLYKKGVSFDDLHADTLSFLMTKAHMFNPTTGHKAYSYFGTIIKHRLLGELIKADKTKINTLGYDDFSSTIESRDDMMYEIRDTPDGNVLMFLEGYKEFLTQLLVEQSDIITRGGKANYKSKEILIGHALIEVITSRKELFGELNGSNKYNKNLITSTIVEMTLLEAKDVRLGIKKLKEDYLKVRESYISNGVL